MLHSLPSELVVLLASYSYDTYLNPDDLPASHLPLLLVCKRFYSILSNEDNVQILLEFIVQQYHGPACPYQPRKENTIMLEELELALEMDLQPQEMPALKPGRDLSQRLIKCYGVNANLNIALEGFMQNVCHNLLFLNQPEAVLDRIFEHHSLLITGALIAKGNHPSKVMLADGNLFLLLPQTVCYLLQHDLVLWGDRISSSFIYPVSKAVGHRIDNWRKLPLLKRGFAQGDVRYLLACHIRWDFIEANSNEDCAYLSAYGGDFGEYDDERMAADPDFPLLKEQGSSYALSNRVPYWKLILAEQKAGLILAPDFWQQYFSTVYSQELPHTKLTEISYWKMVCCHYACGYTIKYQERIVLIPNPSIFGFVLWFHLYRGDEVYTLHVDCKPKQWQEVVQTILDYNSDLVVEVHCPKQPRLPKGEWMLTQVREKYYAIKRLNAYFITGLNKAKELLS